MTMLYRHSFALRGLSALGVVGSLLFAAADSVSAGDQVRARILPVLPADGRNAHYGGNRPPLLASPLTKLPVGSIQPGGWLRRQLELEADGFSGRLTEISKWCKFDDNAWVTKQAEGHSGWEELPYWLKGYIDLGYVLNDRRIIDESNRWINGVIASQETSGYFGPLRNFVQHDIWPNMVMLYALRTHYEATRDARVLPFMTRYFRWLMTIPLEHYLPESWQKIRGGDNLDHIYWLYNQTNEPWLLDLARLNHERTADWVGGIASWHGVNICQSFREPGQYYQQAKDIRYLRATERNYATVMGLYGQVPGGMFGADENAREGYAGPRQGAETCSMVEFMGSDHILLRITGDPVWADRCEDIAFNSLPAAMTADMKALHYLTAPNMVQLDSANKAPMFDNDGDMLTYNPHRYRCCQHNVAFGWPYYAEHLWMATPDNGLAAVYFSACTVKAKVGRGVAVTITESTGYPFDESVEMRISPSKPVEFPLALRIPSWCPSPKVSVNGKAVAVDGSMGTWIVLRRSWKEGDVVRVELPQHVSVKVWKENRNSVSVQRGPLFFSLKIGERWSRFAGTDAWPGYEVFPTTPWNYGLILDDKDPAGSFHVVRNSYNQAALPFGADNIPVELKAKGRRISQWRLEDNGLVGALQPGPVRSTEPLEEITLVPMGFARLRISSFPQIGNGPGTNDWK